MSRSNKDDTDAAMALMSLNEEDINAAIGLLLLKKDINGLEAAALTILNLNKRDVSDETLKEALKETDFDEVKENANLFASYGIIPEVEIVNEMSGGEDTKRKREDEEPPRSVRSRTPTQKMIEYKSPPPKSLAAQQKEEKAERSARLLDVDASKQFQGKEYSDLDPYLKGLDVCQPRMASEFMKALFPTKAVIVWKEVLRKNCRDIYEPGSIETQCNNTIGKVRDEDICYICGFDFDDRTEGLQPTCEHILPIIQAIFFLDLYRGADKGKHTPEQLDILRKEYAWAHRCCNYVKGDDSFLVTKLNKVTNLPRWDFGVNQTTRVLSNIHKTYKYEGTSTIQALIATKGYDIWLRERLDYIKTEKMNNIVNYIDSKGMGGTVIMIGFGNCVDASKMNDDFKEILQKIERGEDLSDIQSTKKARRMTMGGKTYRHRNNGKLSTSSKRRSQKGSN
jgi:hypothetical protein